MHMVPGKRYPYIIFFFVSSIITCCGYSEEAPQWGTSYVYVAKKNIRAQLFKTNDEVS